jgi:phosphoserine phosphatase
MPLDDERLLVCDLDGTLITINSFPAYVRFAGWDLVKRGRLRAAVRLATALATRKVLRRPHARLKQAVCEISSEVDAAATARWATTTLATHGNREVLELVGAWDGRVLLTTSAPESYAEHFRAAAGMADVHGSRSVDGRFVENVAETKVRRLREEGIVQVEAAISDDEVIDGPLLRAARHAYVVTPTGIVSSSGATEPLTAHGGTPPTLR